jgi:hypothetical protein
MSTIYEFTIKKLKEDDRGYASSLYCEMQGTADDGRKTIAGAAISFGGEDYKPYSSWSQDEIDFAASTLQTSMQESIDYQLNAKVEAQAAQIALQANEIAALKGAA